MFNQTSYTYTLFSLDSLEKRTIYQTIYGDLCIQFRHSLKNKIKRTCVVESNTTQLLKN